MIESEGTLRAVVTDGDDKLEHNPSLKRLASVQNLAGSIANSISTRPNHQARGSSCQLRVIHKSMKGAIIQAQETCEDRSFQCTVFL
jgi:hypothetical protein